MAGYSIILFLTNGTPTVGVTDLESILTHVTQANQGARIFTFGVGYEVNTHFLDRLSQENKGAFQYVRPEEDIEVAVSTLFRQISSPVLEEARLEWDKIIAYDVYPPHLGDIFQGSQLILLGRYRGQGDEVLRLLGSVGKQRKTYPYELFFPRKTRENEFIPRLWANRKIGFLLDQIKLYGESEELIGEVTRLGKKYGIVTPYTSILVREEERTYGALAPERRERYLLQPEVMMAPTGKEAFDAAREISGLKEKKTVEESSLKTVKYVGEKTFCLREGIWIDTDYPKGKDTIKVTYLKEDYFRLLREKPELGKYFALGEKVIVCWEGECFQVE